MALCGRPSAMAIAPSAWATIARSTSASKAQASSRSSSRVTLASSRAPQASAISRWAGRIQARRMRSCVTLVRRRIVAHAASARPCAILSSASPGCGSRPSSSRRDTPPRLHELAAERMDLRLLIARSPGRLAPGPPRALAGPARLDQCLRPCALEMHDLGAVHQAGALNAIMSGCPSQSRENALVHSRARPRA